MCENRLRDIREQLTMLPICLTCNDTKNVIEVKDPELKISPYSVISSTIMNAISGYTNSTPYFFPYPRYKCTVCTNEWQYHNLSNQRLDDLKGRGLPLI